jgi:hypothetical protein
MGFIPIDYQQETAFMKISLVDIETGVLFDAFSISYTDSVFVE